MTEMQNPTEFLIQSQGKKNYEEQRLVTVSKDHLDFNSSGKSPRTIELSNSISPRDDYAKLAKLTETMYIDIMTGVFHDLHMEITARAFRTIIRQIVLLMICLGDGTAALVVLVEHDTKRLIIANAGDQRVVLARNNVRVTNTFSSDLLSVQSAIPLTTDHKPDEPNEKLRIYDVGGFINEQKRVDGILALSRALGTYT